ncbi:tyrosine-type recombinase/integrase [Devosia sp.]|uniref:tyrosine-type recombinase/integrase n=1 Tax=Devosia sp. TaxID=1871048 RepID=UPI0027325E8C|nr:tyrosine-type recombinase/integrase [Devosia sp.]MDP2779036.1 tyrosine-type recombinase/integrase [Devosia sp.]
MTLNELRQFMLDQTKDMKFDLAASTQVDYRRIIEAVDDDFVAYLRSAPNSTFYKRKAAILWRLRFSLAESITSIDEASAHGETNLGWRLDQARVYAELIKSVAAETRKKSRSQKGKSKKIGLKALSKKGDFRERLVTAAGKAGVVGILLLSIAGVRPAEIAKGVALKAFGEHGLEIHINGVKHTQTTGHERRAQRHDARRWSLSAKLLTFVKKAGGNLLFSRSPDLLRDDIKRAAARAKLPLTISPYTLRHCFSGDLKKAGWSPVEIAKAMGHASTRTGGRYARKQSAGSGTSSMTAVWASGEVREFDKPTAEEFARMGRSKSEDLAIEGPQ